MIVQLIVTPLVLLLRGIILLLPTAFVLPDWGLAFLNLMSKGLYIFPADVWFICVGNIVFWYVALFSWSTIEWVYKKIPGVN